MTSSSQPPLEEPSQPQYLTPIEPAETRPVAPVRPAPARRTSSGTVLLAVAALVAVGGIAFAGGRVTASAPQPTAATSGGFGQGGFGGGAGGFPGASGAPGASGLGDFRGGRGGGAISATVTAVTPDHVTVQIGGATGPTIDVKVDSTTTYHTEQPATASAVKAGSQVLVQFNPATGSSDQGTGGGGSGGQAQGGSGAAGTAGPGGPFASRTAKDITVVAR